MAKCENRGCGVNSFNGGNPKHGTNCGAQLISDISGDGRDVVKLCEQFTTTPTTSITVERLEEYKTQEHNLNVFNENYKQDQAKITELQEQIKGLEEAGNDLLDILKDNEVPCSDQIKAIAGKFNQP